LWHKISDDGEFKKGNIPEDFLESQCLSSLNLQVLPLPLANALV
jgi:hypothetical protein